MSESCAYELTKYSDQVVDEIVALLKLKMNRVKSDLHRNLERTWEMKERYEDVVTPNGMIPVWESGRDCDMVSYGNAYILNAPTFSDWQKHVDEVYYWAEGPVGVSIIPSWDEYLEARGQSYSRDLIAEATEDGHPHVVYT